MYHKLQTQDSCKTLTP